MLVAQDVDGEGCLMHALEMIRRQTTAIGVNKSAVEPIGRYSLRFLLRDCAAIDPLG